MEKIREVIERANGIGSVWQLTTPQKLRELYDSFRRGETRKRKT